MRDDNSFVVVRTATTPSEAKVLVALLQAEGVQALVDGDALADEVAVSRRAMNLNGVQVRVPARQLDEAKEILDAARVDERELEAQALAAGPAPPVPLPAPAPSGSGSRTSLWVALVAVPAAVVFFVLWQDNAAFVRAIEHFRSVDGRTRYERTPDGWRRVDRATGLPTLSVLDRDGDGNPEVTQWYDGQGKVIRTQRDLDNDGEPDQMDELRADGKHVVWYHGKDHRVDHLEVRAADGTVLRRQHFDGNAFVDDR